MTSEGRTPSSEELAAVPNPHAKAIWHTRSACPWCRAYDEAQRLLAEREAAAEWVQMHRAWGVLDD